MYDNTPCVRFLVFAFGLSFYVPTCLLFPHTAVPSGYPHIYERFLNINPHRLLCVWMHMVGYVGSYTAYREIRYRANRLTPDGGEQPFVVVYWLLSTRFPRRPCPRLGDVALPVVRAEMDETQTIHVRHQPRPSWFMALGDGGLHVPVLKLDAEPLSLRFIQRSFDPLNSKTSTSPVVRLPLAIRCAGGTLKKGDPETPNSDRILRYLVSRPGSYTLDSRAHKITSDRPIHK